MFPGAYLVALGGWPIVLVGLASIAAGILYTGGPWPLGYHGLGDLFVFVFFGLVAVVGTVWIETGFIPALAWLVAIPAGFLSTAILVVNNLRDRETDARAGKRTLAVRFGRSFAVRQYAALVLLPFLATAAIALQVRSPWPLLTLASLPTAVSLLRAVRASEGRALNQLLGATAKLLLTWSMLLCLPRPRASFLSRLGRTNGPRVRRILPPRPVPPREWTFGTKAEASDQYVHRYPGGRRSGASGAVTVTSTPISSYRAPCRRRSSSRTTSASGPG